MWSDVFEGLRRRMTCISAAIFGLLILVIVCAAYGFIWWNVLQHEKEELVDNITTRPRNGWKVARNPVLRFPFVRAACWPIMCRRIIKR